MPPWVTRSGVATTDARALAGLDEGAVLDVVDAESKLVGRGLLSTEADMFACLLSKTAVPIDASFFAAAIDRALRWRKRLALGDTDALRLVNGEGDDLPGLVIDRFGEYVVVQPYRSCWRPWLPTLVRALDDQLRPRGILVKSRERSQDGGGFEVAAGEPMDPGALVRETGLNYLATFKQHGKPGLYLDQRETRTELRGLAAGRRVLNLFSFTGAFSVAAAAGGARAVTSVDATKACAETACANFALNELDPEAHEFLIGDVFEYLREARRHAFDLAVVDPPSFAQTKSSVLGGAKGLEALYGGVARVLAPGAWLIACSNHAQTDPKTFAQLVARALRKEGRAFRLIGTRGLPADHPTHPALPRSRYLKVLVGSVD
jgi:23S rRNA (cytosine1962-C5)-methyltransferase